MKFLSNLLEILAAIILVPLILLYKLVAGFFSVTLIVLLICSPLILIGFIAWLIFN